MVRRVDFFVILLLSAAIFAGCVTTAPDRPAGVREAANSAWSLSARQDEIIVSVSPARRTLQIAGTSAAVIGAGVDAVVNAKHRKAILEVLNGYDPGAAFEECIAARLEQAVPQGIQRVGALGSTAGFSSRREAEQARYEAIARKDHDVLLDLNMTYGIFGAAGTLVAKLDGKLRLVPEGTRIWDRVIVVTRVPILACNRPTDPTKQLGPNFSSPRLKAEGDAIAQWTGDNGQQLREEFEKAVDGAVSALLCDLGLVEEAIGEYHLGRVVMNRKRFEDADGHFARALELDPGLLDAKNGRAVNLALNGQVDDALQVALELTEEAPDYGPAWFNTAWWYAIEKEDAAAAKPYYEKALELSMPPNRKIEKALGN